MDSMNMQYRQGYNDAIQAMIKFIANSTINHNYGTSLKNVVDIHDDVMRYLFLENSRWMPIAEEEFSVSN